LLDLDESIISATIASSIGEILSMRYKAYVEEMKPSEELLNKSGSLIAMVSAMVQQAETPFGDCSSIMIAYGKIQVLEIPIKNKHIIVELGTIPNAPALDIANKVTKLATRLRSG
jgi:hypothetical protein